MFKTLLIPIFALISATASAMPHASLNQLGQQNPDCDETQVSNGFAELAHHVNLILQEGMTTWHDPRGPLSQKAKELGLSAEDQIRIRKTTGEIICPGNLGAKASQGTAMLIGDGSQIVTDAHIFIDPETNTRRDPLGDCMFINQYDYKPVKLNFSSEKTYRFYTKAPKTEWYKDRAIVKLTHKVTDTPPFPIDMDNTPLKPGDKLMMISADQEQLTFQIPKVKVKAIVMGGKYAWDTQVNEEPIAQSCATINYYPATSRASSVIYANCNDTAKASGSIMFIRKKDGQIMAKALLTQGGIPAADYKPFKVGKGVPMDELSFTLGVGLDSDLSADVTQMQNSVHLADEK